MSGEDVIKILMRENVSDQKLYSLLEGIVPPELCRISLSLLAANHAEIMGIKARLERQQDAKTQWWLRLLNGIVTGVMVSVMFAVAKSMGWL